VTTSKASEEPIRLFKNQSDWAAWLQKNHRSNTGLWLRIAIKGSGLQSVSYAEALEEALCYGWIDGQKGSIDEVWWLQRFSPRRARSRWSKVNTEKAAALIAQGRMRPPGLAEIEAAKADGRWERAYAGVAAAQVPDDLQAAFDANPAAAAFFATLNSQNRFAVLYRIQDAKRPQTRAARIEKFVAMLARGEKLYP
jgi:uncharacterized protein YdeI (YjbR/CyaY-like superfamily)